MGQLDVAMAQKLTRLLATEDIALAGEIRDEDDAIDELHASVFDFVLGETGRAPDRHGRRHPRLALPRAVRRPRVSIAKKVEYLATGDWAGASSVTVSPA